MQNKLVRKGLVLGIILVLGLLSLTSVIKSGSYIKINDQDFLNSYKKNEVIKKPVKAIIQEYENGILTNEYEKKISLFDIINLFSGELESKKNGNKGLSQGFGDFEFNEENTSISLARLGIFPFSMGLGTIGYKIWLLFDIFEDFPNIQNILFFLVLFPYLRAIFIPKFSNESLFFWFATGMLKIKTDSQDYVGVGIVEIILNCFTGVRIYLHFLDLVIGKVDKIQGDGFFIGI